MSDLDQRFDKVEQQLQTIANNQSSSAQGNQPSPNNDEIDLRELWNVLWQAKWWIIGVTFLFSVVGVLYALSLPNLYESQGIYAPAQDDDGASGLAGQYGGLAAIAGVSLGGAASNDIDQAIALAKSWPFLESFVQKNDLEPYVLGLKGWDKETRKLIWNTDVFDVDNWMWLTTESGESLAPTSFDVYERLRGLVQVTNDTKTGMVAISVTHFSPEISEKWVRLLVRSLNDHFQRRDTIAAQRNVNYLERKILETSVSEMQSVFYGMVEKQTQILMLAEVSDEYLLKEVIPPKMPEQKSKPPKKLICILFFILGGAFSCVFILVRDVFFRKK